VVTSIQESGLPKTDYYAPTFKVEVEGRELKPESIGDILEVKVTMDLENLTSVDLSINNWDSTNFGFKYSDSNIFDVGNRIHVQMGYADRLLSMAHGVIATLTPRFSESGPPTIGVTALDSMFKLRDSKPKEGEQKKYVEKTDSDIAREVAVRNKMQFQIDDTKEKHSLVIQKNQDDAQFLMERAKRIDYDCYVQVDPKTGDDKLFFAKPTDGRDGRRSRIYVFEWGNSPINLAAPPTTSKPEDRFPSLINFSPTLTLSKQVGKVTVRGWDPKTKSKIAYTASKSDLPGMGGDGGGTSGPEAAEKRLQNKQDTVVDTPVTSAQEARDLAISLLRERAYEFITGSGQVIGLPDLRPGDNVELTGLGKRFSGVYYVKKVEHSIGGSGYRTQFEVRKPFDGGTK
jgi:phage protein D